MRTITLEEHFTTPAFRAGAGRHREEHAKKVGGRGYAVKVNIRSASIRAYAGGVSPSRNSVCHSEP